MTPLCRLHPMLVVRCLCQGEVDAVYDILPPPLRPRKYLQNAENRSARVVAVKVDDSSPGKKESPTSSPNATRKRSKRKEKKLARLTAQDASLDAEPPTAGSVTVSASPEPPKTERQLKMEQKHARVDSKREAKERKAAELAAAKQLDKVEKASRKEKEKEEKAERKRSGRKHPGK